MIDLKVSNLGSVLGGFRRVGAEVEVTTDLGTIERADAIVLPGVGAFGDGMARLEELGLIEAIRTEATERHKPILGICLGMQLLGEASEEHGAHRGLGLVRGRVVRLRPKEPHHRVPNMGWCDVTPRRSDGILFASRPRTYYFAHSYHLECADPGDVAATLNYGGLIAAAVERGNVAGVQFHPELSQEAGLDLLESFTVHASEMVRL